jgi:tRNA dimethylallyltransferase
MNKVIIIFGPTGVGKTKLSLELAKELNGEIISADSMQIYKKMDIGTAKILKNEMQGFSHYLLDIVEPTQQYSVGEYVKEANKIISDIISRNKTPIIVGGTGLYINALTNNYDFHEAAKDEQIRKKYKQLAEEKGKEFVYNLLKEKNLIRASQLHPNDVKRVVRALEIIEINENKDQNNKKTSKKQENNYDFLLFGLNMEREQLYENINLRVEKMFEEGLIKEVKDLLKSGLKKEDQSMQGIGYKEVIEGLEKNQPEKEIKEEIKKRTRNYAKRQLTFMRGMKNLIWIEAGQTAKNEILKSIKEPK